MFGAVWFNSRRLHQTHYSTPICVFRKTAKRNNLKNFSFTILGALKEHSDGLAHHLQFASFSGIVGPVRHHENADPILGLLFYLEVRATLSIPAPLYTRQDALEIRPQGNSCPMKSTKQAGTEGAH